MLPHTNARPLLQRSQIYRAPTTATLGARPPILFFVFPGQTLCLQSFKVRPESVINLFSGGEILLRIPTSFLFLCRALFFSGLLLVFVDGFHT
jgi:hypothetical protein